MFDLTHRECVVIEYIEVIIAMLIVSPGQASVSTSLAYVLGAVLGGIQIFSL